MTASCPVSFTATAAGQGGGHARGRLLTTVLAAVALAGCSGLDPVARQEPITDPTQLYMSLTLDRPAINLSTVAPYDTVQLTATPRNGLGEPLDSLPAAKFRLDNPSDSTMVTVTPDGLVQARGVTSFFGVTIRAELRGRDNVLQEAQARIKVNVTTDPPPQLASVSADPVPPDTAKIGLMIDQGVYDFNLLFFSVNRFNRYLKPAIAPPRALDAMGNEIPGVLFEITSLDLAILPAEITNGFATPPSFFVPDMELRPLRVGQARLVARTTLYGVTMADTMLVTVTNPVLQSVQAVTFDGVPRFQPSEIRLPPNGIVFFQNTLADEVDVTFDDPTHVAPAPAGLCENLAADPDTYGPGPYCEAGDALMPGSDPTAFIPLFKTERLRQFPVPGVYRYHSTRTGASGQIIVTE